MDVSIWAIVGILVLATSYLLFRQKPVMRVPFVGQRWDWSPPQAKRVAPAIAIGPMTQDQLLAILATKYSMVGVPKPGTVEPAGTGTNQQWAVPCFDFINGVQTRVWVPYAVNEKGEAFWMEREPKPVPVPPVLSFGQKVQLALDAKVLDGSLKAGGVEKVYESQRRALLSVITPTNATRQAIVSADAQDRFTVEVI